MLGQFPAPVLAVAPDVLKDLEGGDALHGLWALFTKCKDSLRDGRRLENISWRLWYREMENHTCSAPVTPDLCEKSAFIENENVRLHPPREIYRPVSPVSPVLDNDQASVLSSSIGSTSSSRPRLNRAHSSSSAVGKIICEVVSTPAEDCIAPLPPTIGSLPAPPKETAPLKPPTLSLPNSLRPEGIFPSVVVVNPTPHPTPPATPLTAAPPALTLPPSPSSPPPPPVFSPAPAVATGPQSVPQSAGPRPPSPSPSPQLVLSASPIDDPTLCTDAPPKASSDRGPVSQIAAAPRAATPPPEHASPTLAGEPVPVARAPSAHTGHRPSPSDKSEPAEPGTSVMSRASALSRASTGTRPGTRRSATTGGRPAKGKTAINGGRHAHAHASGRPGITRQHSTGGKAMKGKAALTALRRTTSVVDAVEPAGAAPAARRAPPPVVTNVAPAAVQPAPPSAKSNASRHAARQAPQPVRRGSSGKGKAVARRPPTRPGGRVIVANDDDDESEGFETDKAENGEAEDDESGWEELTPEEREAEARAKREAEREAERAAEEQRKKDMFKKLPPRSYSNLARTQSAGLLSQLLNPDPNLFPPNHPYRMGFSTEDLSRLPHQQQKQQQPSPLRRQGVQSQQQLLHARPPAPAAEPSTTKLLHAQPPAVAGPSTTTRPRVSPPHAFAAPLLTKSKSGAALPEMATVTAQMATATAQAATSAGTRSTRPSPSRTGGSAGSGRGASRGPPHGLEMEDESESDDDDENQIQVATSLAAQRLAAIQGGRRRGLFGLGGRTRSAAPTPPPPPPAPAAPAEAPVAPALLQQLPTVPPPARSDTQLAERPARPGLAPTTSAPIPVMTHPYNLPAPAPPTTPRTTRRQMLSTELTESLRHNLLWERQVSRVNLGARRRAGVLGAGAGLRPLTTLGAAAGEGSGRVPPQQQQQPQQHPQLHHGASQEQLVRHSADEEEVRRQQRLKRQQSWGDNFHTRGW